MSDEIKVPSEDKPIVKPEYTEVIIPPVEGTHLVELDGLFETVPTTPSGKARRVFEQIRLNEADGSVCFYDAKNNSWVCVGANSVYAGYVVSNAAGTPFPAGWSVTNPSTGNYTVTHNLGHTDYVVTATFRAVTGFIQITSRGTANFVVNCKNASSVDANSDFFFTLVVQQ
jgi:hypothetical protein